MQAVSESFRCECGSTDFVDREGSRYCINCGLGTIIAQRTHRVPGVGAKNEYGPRHPLCYGDNLGNTNIRSAKDKTALLKFLTKHDRKKEVHVYLEMLREANLIPRELYEELQDKLKASKYFDIGIRARQLQNECMRSEEPPITQRMKNYGSHLCKDFGFRNNILLSTALGWNLKWIAMILTMQNDGAHSKDLTVAAFLLNVRKLVGEEKAVEIMSKVWGKEINGKLCVPKQKKLFLAKARDLIRLDKLVV